MKLLKITVGNFKNIAKTTIQLSKITALVSTNNYGKTNLLEAIQFGFDFIAASSKGRNNMMHWSKGIPLAPSLAGEEFVFSIEFDAPELGEYRFVRYGFAFSWFNDQETGARITDEVIEMRANESVRYTSYLKRDKGLYKGGKAKTNFRKVNLVKDALAIDALSLIDDIDIADVIVAIKTLSYRMCNTLELDNSFKPNPIEFDFGSNSSVVFDDDDIPRAISVLKRDNPDQYKVFLDTIYDLFPEFLNVALQAYTINGETVKAKAIMVSAGEEEVDKPDIPYRIRDEIYKLIIESRHLNQPISMEYMSTGTKRIFWLIANAVFAGCYKTSFLGVDEVETSIHPKMIQSLLEALSEILGESTMLITSHSPYLVQYLKPGSIYVGVPNEDGVAKFRKIQQSKIKQLISVTRDLETSVGEYLFELMSGDDDSAEILSAYLEDS